MGLHYCHANGCEDPDTHPELPFCKRHWNMLPVAHRNKLWRLKPAQGCGVCNPRSAMKEWAGLVNLAIALLCRIEYGRHDCPESFLDETGFCWGCGCYDVPKVYKVSEAVIKKFNLPVMEDPL
jgi:hypothetical protein